MNWPDDFINKIICGDCLETMKQIPAGTIDMIMTSPPYWGLRDYGFEQIFGGDPDCKHTWSSAQTEHDNLRYRGHHSNVGSNRNPEIHPGKEGSGGKYCSCGAWKGQLGLEPTPEIYIEHLTEIFSEAKRALKKEGTLWLNIGDTYAGSGSPGGDFKNNKGDKYLRPYNRNEKQINIPGKSLCMIPERLAWALIQDGWILRNKIIWNKPNAMPSSVKDRFGNRWEYIFLFSKSRRYYFDLDAVKIPHKESATRWGGNTMKVPKDQKKMQGSAKALGSEERAWRNPAGKNPGDIFEVNTQPFPEAHFAVFPEKLCEKPIKAGCPKDGIVLDPFAGAGTALFVAQQLRRRFIGIDIKKEYCELAKKRLAQGVL